MKIGFDFDSTLTTRKMQTLAKTFIKEGNEVWIVTTRMLNPPITLQWDNKTLFKIAKEVNIPKSQIIFTEGKDKVSFLNDFDLFFDDDEVEIDLIDEQSEKCIGIHVTPPRYK